MGRIPPQQRIILYSPTEWEDFVHEWAHYCLKPLYWKVERFTGAGDRGIDIAGYADTKKLKGICGYGRSGASNPFAIKIFCPTGERMNMARRAASGCALLSMVMP